MFAFIMCFCVGQQSLNYGLHTHAAFPRQLAWQYDQWLIDQGKTPVQWWNKDLNGLLAHIEDFNPTLLVLGGVAWEMKSTRGTLLESMSPGDSELSVSLDTDLKVGDWLEIGGEFVAVKATTPSTLIKRSESSFHRAGSVITLYRSHAHPDAIHLLQRLQVPVLIPLVIGPSVSDRPASWPGETSQTTGTDIYQHPRFKLANDLGAGNQDSPLTQFLVGQFKQFLSSLITAGEREDHNIIAHWVLGNEPDSFLRVSPDSYGRALRRFNDALVELEGPGGILLSTFNGSNPDFIDWVSELASQLSEVPKLGRVQGAGINFYVPRSPIDVTRIEIATKNLDHAMATIAPSIGAIKPKIIKELGFYPQDSDSTGPPWSQSDLRQLRATLSSLNYDEVVWFNQMPSGNDHGDLIQSAAQPIPTPLGELFSAINKLPMRAPKRQAEPIYIPDPRFKAYLVKLVDINKDGEIDYEEALNVKRISLRTRQHGDIRDLTGITHCENLIDLSIGLEGPVNVPDLNRLNNLRFLSFLSTRLESWPDLPRTSRLSMWIENVAPASLDLSDVELDSLTIRALEWQSFIMPRRLNLLVIGEMDRWIFDELPPIKEIIISQCAFNSLPSLPNSLERLQVRYTPLQSLDQVGVLGNLVFVALKDTQLRVFKTRGRFPHLGDVTITDSILEEAEFDDVPLGSLDLSRNQLKRLTNLPSTLKTLILNQNQLGSASLELPSQLIRLEIRNNQLIQLPPIVHLAELSFLDVSDNQLQRLSEISELPNLSQLKAQDNRITHLPPINHLNKLTDLSLDRNNLTSLPNLDWMNLKYLYLDANSLAMVPDVSKLPDLQYLTVTNNPIESCVSVQRVLDQRDWFYTYLGRAYEEILVQTFLYPPIDGTCLRSDPTEPPQHLHARQTENEILVSWRGGGTRDYLEDQFAVGPHEEDEENRSHCTEISLEKPGPGPYNLVLWTNPPKPVPEPTTIEQNRYAIPHMPRSPGWWTSYRIANPHDVPVDVLAVVRDLNGVILKEETLQLEGIGSWMNTRTTPEESTPAWIELRCPERLIVQQSFGIKASGIACDVPLNNQPGITGDIPVWTQSNYWNGLMIVNPQSQLTTIDFVLFDLKANPVDSSQLAVVGGHNKVILLNQIMDPTIEDSISRLHWESDQPIWIYVLHGNENPKTRLWSSASPLPSASRFLDFPARDTLTEWTMVQPQTQVTRTGRSESLTRLGEVFWLNPGETLLANTEIIRSEANTANQWLADLPITMRRLDHGPESTESYNLPCEWSQHWISAPIENALECEHHLEFISNVAQMVHIVLYDPSGLSTHSEQLYIESGSATSTLSDWFNMSMAPWFVAIVSAEYPESLMVRRRTIYPTNNSERGALLTPLK